MGLCKCQLRVRPRRGSLAETSGEKPEPEDVFILYTVGPHPAKTFLSQLRYFSWQNKLKSKKVEATKNRAGGRPCSRPPVPVPGPRPSAPGGGRGGRGGGCAERGASAPRTSPGRSPRSRVCSRSIRASGRRAIIHAKGPCLDEGREGRASSQNHSLGRCLAFPSVSVMLSYLCGARNEGIQAEEVLSPRRTHRPRERTALSFSTFGSSGKRR